MTWKLPGYVADELLGNGGSAEVWRGHATSTGVPVALKRLPVGDAAQVRAARGEAALLSTLDHPHLIRQATPWCSCSTSPAAGRWPTCCPGAGGSLPAR